MDYLSKWPIQQIKKTDKKYPSLLRRIKNSPKLLYLRGELKENEKCFAIVGTRNCSDYGKEIAFSIAKELSEAGLTVVSGLARGIDTFSHKGALEGKGRTIAVLGTGLDEKSIYPRENLALCKKILEKGGCLISEYPPGTFGKKQNFPKRNRIISGMSLGVLIVEAKLKSGALITANWARKQKKKIFAIPGGIHSLSSKGCNFLIKKGIAKLTESAQDILKELKIKKSWDKTEPKGSSKEEILIINVLKNGAATVDEIVEKTNLPLSKILSVLSVMEINGKVKNLYANVYILT